jgi:hypothetical protein
MPMVHQRNAAGNLFHAAAERVYETAKNRGKGDWLRACAVPVPFPAAFPVGVPRGTGTSLRSEPVPRGTPT